MGLLDGDSVGFRSFVLFSELAFLLAEQGAQGANIADQLRGVMMDIAGFADRPLVLNPLYNGVLNY